MTFSQPHTHSVTSVDSQASNTPGSSPVMVGSSSSLTIPQAYHPSFAHSLVVGIRALQLLVDPTLLRNQIPVLKCMDFLWKICYFLCPLTDTWPLDGYMVYCRYHQLVLLLFHCIFGLQEFWSALRLNHSNFIQMGTRSWSTFKSL